MNDARSLGSQDRFFLPVWSMANIFLLVLTWRLWVPGFASFPRVPLLNEIEPVALSLALGAALGLVVGLSLATFAVKPRFAMAMVATSFGAAFLCNQHGLQPWAWQAFIVAVLTASLPMSEAKVWIGRLLISVYLYSAIGKFDYQFAYSLGISFVDAVLDWLRIADPPLGMTKPIMALLFPAIELLVAIGLMLKRTRKIAACLAIVLHVSLIAILSPWGLGHRPPVLLWNSLSVFLVCWAFLQNDKRHQKDERPPPLRRRLRLGSVFALVVIAGPVLRPLELWDHWLAWGLYSPSNSRVELLVPEAAANARAGSFGERLVMSERYPGMLELDIAWWSLDELGVPVYPQSSFQKSVAIQWLRSSQLGGVSKLFELSSANPVTGARKRTEVTVDATTGDF